VPLRESLGFCELPVKDSGSTRSRYCIEHQESMESVPIVDRGLLNVGMSGVPLWFEEIRTVLSINILIANAGNVQGQTNI
jgi:hypothetical protein